MDDMQEENSKEQITSSGDESVNENNAQAQYQLNSNDSDAATL
jgi:hypothetical protein